MFGHIIHCYTTLKKKKKKRSGQYILHSLMQLQSYSEHGNKHPELHLGNEAAHYVKRRQIAGML